MKSIVNDFCLKLFLAENELRPALTQISKQGDYSYATDTNTIIRFKNTSLALPYNEVEKYPAALNYLFKKHGDEFKDITTDDLFASLIHTEICTIVNKDAECGNCDGSGVCTCGDCGHKHECGICGGEGFIITKVNSFSVVFDGNFYGPEFIERVIRVAKYKGVETIRVNHTENKQTLFVVGDAEIIVMQRIS